MKTKHGVLFYTGKDGDLIRYIDLLTIERNTWLETPMPDYPHLLWQFCEIAEKYALTHLWIMPQVSRGEFELCQVDPQEWNLKLHYEEEGVTLKSAYGWRQSDRGGQWAFNIIFPPNTRWAGNDTHPGWIRNVTPKQLLVTIAYIEKALGVQMGGSPSTAGWKLIEMFNQEHKDWLAYPGVDLEAMHFGGESAFNLVQERPLTVQEQGKKFIHKFDENSAFLNGVGTSDGYVGAGTPVHVFHGQGLDEKKVGVWRCTIENFPANLPFTIMQETEAWLAAPIIRILRYTGHEVTIHEGYVFPEKHLTLKAWAEFLWAMRKLLKSPDAPGYNREESRNNAYEAIKQIINSTIGLTIYGGFTDEEKSTKKRPDFNMQAVARTFEVMYHMILKIRREYDVTPVIAYIDALYYIGDEENGKEMLPALVAREDKLGGFKYEGRIELTDEVRAILQDDTSTSVKLGKLNKIGWVK